MATSPLTARNGSVGSLGSRSTQFARVDAADTSLSIARWCSSAQAIARQNASGSPYNWQARATVALAQIELGDHAEALDAFRGIKAEESSPVGPLAVRAVVLDANGWKDGAKGDARTLSAAPLLPEEWALIAPLLSEQSQ